VRLLLVGGGGREHALAWRLKQDDESLDLIAAPGNPGIAELARCFRVAASEVRDLVKLARHQDVDAVLVGPEAPLAAGLADALAADRIPVFGPASAAAQLETSKAFAKSLMRSANVPTARATVHTSAESAKRAARSLGAPVVIKASGLAAGKGVVVADHMQKADRAIDEMLESKTLGSAGAELLVEEFMEGEELSLFAVCDGVGAMPLVCAQDHKRLLTGDRGPNTGGMGAYAPVSLATPSLIAQVMDTIVLPTVLAMAERGTPYRGLLYVGLMLTREGPRVVEFNCRFGDPETQAIVPLLQGSLLHTVVAIARGESVRNVELGWNGSHAVTTVVAALGYPGKARTGDVITLPREDDHVLVFHAGTARNAGGALTTAGGRVLAMTGVGSSFAAARDASLGAAATVDFHGKQFRDDIGWRELRRLKASAGAS
jgi:phosphoribosylamine--glycine ligase